MLNVSGPGAHVGRFGVIYWQNIYVFRKNGNKRIDQIVVGVGDLILALHLK